MDHIHHHKWATIQKKVQLRPSGMQYVLLLLQMLKSMFRGENFSLYFLICWFIQQILTPTFSFFLSFFLLQSFFLNFAFSMLHMPQMTQMSHMGMCGWQVCMDMNGYEWLRMGVPGWVCVGVYVTNFQNTFWRLDS